MFSGNPNVFSSAGGLSTLMVPTSIDFGNTNSNTSFVDVNDPNGLNSTTSSANSTTSSGISMVAEDSFLDLSSTDTEDIPYSVEKIVAKRKLADGQVNIQLKLLKICYLQYQLNFFADSVRCEVVRF